MAHYKLFMLMMMMSSGSKYKKNKTKPSCSIDETHLDLKPSIFSTVANITSTDQVYASTNTGAMYSCNDWLSALETHK